MMWLACLEIVVAVATLAGWFAFIGYAESVQRKLRAIEQKVTLIRTAQLEAEQFGTALPPSPTTPRHRLQVRIGNKQLVDITTEQSAPARESGVPTKHPETDRFLWKLQR